MYKYGTRWSIARAVQHAIAIICSRYWHALRRRRRRLTKITRAEWTLIAVHRDKLSSFFLFLFLSFRCDCVCDASVLLFLCQCTRNLLWRAFSFLKVHYQSPLLPPPGRAALRCSVYPPTWRRRRRRAVLSFVRKKSFQNHFNGFCCCWAASEDIGPSPPLPRRLNIVCFALLCFASSRRGVNIKNLIIKERWTWLYFLIHYSFRWWLYSEWKCKL